MIDRVDANSKVGRVKIRLNSLNKWNDQLVTAMINRYKNVYCIGIYDNDNLIDEKMHRLI